MHAAGSIANSLHLGGGLYNCSALYGKFDADGTTPGVAHLPDVRHWLNCCECLMACQVSACALMSVHLYVVACLCLMPAALGCAIG
jgi:hypothetical protein